MGKNPLSAIKVERRRGTYKTVYRRKEKAPLKRRNESELSLNLTINNLQKKEHLNEMLSHKFVINIYIKHKTDLLKEN